MRPAFFLSLAIFAIGVSLAHGVEVVVDTSRAPDLAFYGFGVKVFLEYWYPDASRVLWTPNYREVEKINVQFRKLSGVHAYTASSTNTIYLDIDYYRGYKDAENLSIYSPEFYSVYHELIHIIHQNKFCPAWIYEGLADHMLHSEMKGRHPWFHNMTLERPDESLGDHYTQGYGPAAYFFDWLTAKLYEIEGSDGRMFDVMIADMCRQGGEYNEGSIVLFFGKTWDELWEEMMKSQEKEPDFRVDVDFSGAPDLEQHAHKLKEYLEKLYPGIREYLYTPSYQELGVVKVVLNDGSLTAHDREKLIQGGSNYLRDYPDEDWVYSYWDELLIQLVQQYKPVPHWLATGLRVLTSRRDVTDNLTYRATYSRGYYTAAVFLRWLDLHYQPSGHRLSYWLNEACRDGTYTDQLFITLTGKDVDTLSYEFLHN